jgi:hypothetical protein
MSYDDDSNPNATPSEGAVDHRRGGASAYLRTSIHALTGGEGYFHFGGSQGRTAAEAREEQLAHIASLPKFDGGIGDHIATGGEHVVHLSASGQRVLKFRLSGDYGFCLDEKTLFDSRTFLNRPQLFHRHALPSEYLWRWLVLRKVFGLRTELEGVTTRPDGTLALVISQPFIGESMPAWDEVEFVLTGLGFLRVDNAHLPMPEMHDVVWYRQRDGVLISDAYPRNFRLESSGALIPIDLVVTIVPPGASNILPPATEPFALQNP